MISLTFKLLNLHYLASATIVTPGDGSFTTDLPQVSASGGSGSNDVQIILQLVFAAIGAMALIIIVVAAIQFITSGGEPQETAKARSTIIYAAVGLLLALSAEVIVTFVLNSI